MDLFVEDRTLFGELCATKGPKDAGRKDSIFEQGKVGHVPYCCNAQGLSEPVLHRSTGIEDTNEGAASSLVRFRRIEKVT